jgi:hypothetical protein
MTDVRASRYADASSTFATNAPEVDSCTDATVSAMEHIVCSDELAACGGRRLAGSMSNIAELEKKLNDAVLGGKAMEAFEELYDENIVMQENLEPEYRGKDFNRKREQEFFASVEAWHSGEVLASAVHGDVSFSEW